MCFVHIHPQFPILLPLDISRNKFPFHLHLFLLFFFFLFFSLLLLFFFINYPVSPICASQMCVNIHRTYEPPLPVANNL